MTSSWHGGRPRWRWSGPRRRASRRWRWPRREPSRVGRDRRGRLDAGLPGDGHRHGQAARRPSRRRCRHHGLDLVDPDEDFTVTEFQEALRRRAGRHRRPRRPAAAWWRGPGCTCGPSSTRCARRAGGPTCGRSWTPSPTRRALYARLGRARPGRRRPGWSRPNRRRRRPGARGGRSGAAGPSRRSGPASPPTRRPTWCRSGLRWPRPVLAAPHRAALRGHAGRRPAGGGRARWRGRPGGLPRTASQALGYKELLAHLRRRVLPGRGGRPGRRPAPASWLSASCDGSSGDPRVRWVEMPDDDAAALALLVRAPADGRSITLTKHHGLGNDFLVDVHRQPRPARLAWSELARLWCDAASTESVPTASLVASRAEPTAGPTSAWCSTTPTAAKPR